MYMSKDMRETNKSKCLRAIAENLGINNGHKPKYNCDEYIFNFDDGSVINKKTNEKIFL